MTLVIVPDYVRDAINGRLDTELAKLLNEDRAIAELDREFLYSQLLAYFNKHGEIPDFTLVPNIPEFRIVRGSP